jgi:hypothetical protein
VRNSGKLRQKLQTNSRQILAVAIVAAIVAIGSFTLFASHAATPYLTAEPENGSISTPASKVTDSGASGGAAVKFATGSSGGFQSNCIVKPSVCGYPDETNTGVPPGTTLTNSGSITVTQAGAVIQNLNVNGQIVVKANNVTIRNVKLTSGDYYPIDNSNGNTGLLVEDTEIIATNANVTSGISFTNYTARRVNVHGSSDGFKADSNVTIEDSYIHDLVVTATSHNDGIQTTGGSNVTIRHTTCKLSTTNGANACMQIGNEHGANSNWLITDNLLDGGGWTINAGNGNTNMTVTNNRFTRNAGYGPGTIPGSTSSGNYYDDNGAPID